MEEQTYNQILDFVKYVMSDVLSKMTQVTTTMNDNSNHVKNLTSVVSAPPTRADILEKINMTRQLISDEIDTEVVNRLNEREKDYINLNNFIKDLNTVTQRLSTQIEDNCKILSGLNTKFNITIQVVALIIVIIPIIWGIFEFASKITPHK